MPVKRALPPPPRPAPIGETAHIVAGERLDLSTVPSAMEATIAAMRPKARVSVEREPARAETGCAGKSWCKCGGTFGNAGGLVPSWFGRGCIEAVCPLRAAAAAEAV